MQNFLGENALIFGGASGIEWATARTLLDCGAKVTIADVQQPSEAIDRPFAYIQCNVRHPGHVDDAVQKPTKHARLDRLVYSAGIQHYGP